ncbi:response regulator [Fulvivirgaceae bacterium PWU5]|uniref:Response regulator n=1 Tax=Dawidia cretensis TaxID=2782350 RepID=A0AAP2GNP9_9BACT|nr:response regulator [Dawidia cretensis]MBT1707741.1 response regulator [Dawidia cretensis]
MRWLLCFPVFFIVFTAHGQDAMPARARRLEHRIAEQRRSPQAGDDLHALAGELRQLTLTNADSGRYYLGLLGNLYDVHRHDNVVAAHYFISAGLYFRHQGQPKAALPFMTSALDYLESGTPDSTYATQLLNLGDTYQALGDPSTAEDYHRRALRLFEATDNIPGHGQALYGLGSDLLAQEQYRQAEKHFRAALKLQGSKQDAPALMATHTGLARVYVGMRRSSKAITHYTQALALAQTHQRTAETLALMTELGIYYAEHHNAENAKNYLLQALPLAYMAGDTTTTAHIRATIATLNSRRRGSADERVLLDDLLATTQTADTRAFPEAYYRLAQWYAQRRQFDKAYTQLHAYLQLNDTVHGQEARQVLQRLEAHYAGTQQAFERRQLTAENYAQALQLQLDELSDQRTLFIGLSSLLFVLLVAGVVYHTRVRKRYAQGALQEIDMPKPPSFPTNLPHITSPSLRPMLTEAEADAPSVTTLEAMLAVQDDDASRQALVLVVTDDADTRTRITNTLQDHFRVVTATDGLDGWEKVYTQVPDLVLCETVMPHLSGNALCERLRDATATSHIPVIMLTPHADEEIRVQGLQAGADAYILKSFEPKELRARVQQIIEQREELRQLLSEQVALQTHDIFLSDPESDFINHVTQLLDAHATDAGFGEEEFIAAVGLSRMQLHRKLKALTGKSTTTFLQDFRLTRAKQFLAEDKGIQIS